MTAPELPPEDASDREWAIYLAKVAESQGKRERAAMWRRVAAEFSTPDFTQPEL